MESITRKLTEEECLAFAEALREYKETNWVCDASGARLFAEMMKNWLL